MRGWLRPPQSWNQGTQGDIVLLPGFCEPWTFLEKLALRLHSLGYKIHSIPALNHNTQSVTHSAEILNQYIQDNSLNSVILLGHSKGGLIAKTYLDAHPQTVTHVFTVSTPHQGTYLGYLYICNLAELLPNSPVIQKIIQVHNHNSKITNIYSRVDNHILPNRHALLPNTENIQIDTIGHTRILEDIHTYNVIKDHLLV